MTALHWWSSATISSTFNGKTACSDNKFTLYSILGTVEEYHNKAIYTSVFTIAIVNNIISSSLFEHTALHNNLVFFNFVTEKKKHSLSFKIWMHAYIDVLSISLVFFSVLRSVGRSVCASPIFKHVHNAVAGDNHGNSCRCLCSTFLIARHVRKTCEPENDRKIIYERQNSAHFGPGLCLWLLSLHSPKLHTSFLIARND